MDGILKISESEDLSIHDTDEITDVEKDDFQREEFVEFIIEESGEDPLSEYVHSACYDLEGNDSLCRNLEQDGEPAKCVHKNESEDTDVQAACSCSGKIANVHKQSNHGRFEEVVKTESEENPGQDVNPPPKVLCANLNHTEFEPKSVNNKEVDQAGSAEEISLQKLVPNDSLQLFCVENGQRILENAVHDWYKRLVIHGPVGDNEILEAAHQLAQNFSIDFSPNMTWLANFKIRVGISEDPGTNNERAGESAEVLFVESEESEPPEKRIRVEGRSNVTATEAEVPRKEGSGKQFLSTSDVKELIDQLVVSHGMSENQAVHWLNRFMAQVIAWIISMASSKKLGMYSVRLKVALLAKQMGVAGFTFGDEFYIKMKCHRPNSFKHVDNKRSRISWNTFWDVVAVWYDAEASRRLVSPGELERKVVEVGQGMDVHPKDFFRKFMGHYGLYCDLNGKRALFRKPSVGLLRCRFEIAYVVWYYDWPADIDNVIVNGCYIEDKCWAILKNYMAALTEWFLEISLRTELTPEKIELQELYLAEVMCCPEIKLDLWRAWRSTWIEATTGILIRIRYFSRALEKWCKKTESVPDASCKASLFKIPRYNLQTKACEIAKSSALPFQPTKRWLKNWLIRIVESNGNYFSERAIMEDREKFDEAFDQWYRISGCVVGSSTSLASTNSEQTARNFEQIVNEFNAEIKHCYLMLNQKGKVNYDSFKQMAEAIAVFKGLGKFSVTKVWMKSFLDNVKVSSNKPRSVGSRGTASTSKSVYTQCAKVCETPMTERHRKGVALQQEPLVTEESTQLSEYNDEIAEWYVKESLVRTVLPGELERKLTEKPGQSNAPKASPNKRCPQLQQLIGRHGLCFIYDGCRSMFKKALGGLSRKIFEIEFLVWYHQWPLTVEEMVKKESAFVWKRVEKGQINFKPYKTALIKACAAEPEASGIRRLEIEREQVEGLALSGMWASEFSSLMSKWSKAVTDAVKIITEYDAVMVWRYRRDFNIWQTSDEMINLAEGTAQTLGLRDFRASKSWLKRFVELNGMRVMKMENSKVRWAFITPDKILNIEYHVFEEIFDAWWNQEYYKGNVNICSDYWIEVSLGAHIQQLRSTMLP